MIDSCRDATQLVNQARHAGKVVGLVPTMGALHEGHLSLVRAATEVCDYVVVSIFVNPTQFGASEDLSRYPRTLSDDLEALSKYSVDLVFHPQENQIYPENFTTFVTAPKVGDDLEGTCRPGHFRGVATVVLQLFQILPADIAFFGWKDYQQCLVIRDMVRDLHVSTEIRSCPIIREPDGLAMSSRNQYLSSSERKTALGISKGLERAAASFAAGERDPTVLENNVRQTLAEGAIDRIDYVAVRCAQTLQPLTEITSSAVILVAAYVGSTRLIDNRQLGPESEAGLT
ncbi:MAG: pantoate--beta-alanine ligase [Planctomycetaceae bacterium]|nr:pantoate--beta-alanine ligase [Planctomycetaceae bacterium]